MCVALVLVLNNFYLLYDSLVDYLEHICGALLLFGTIAIVFFPVIATLTADEDNDERHFVAIIVLFAGVVGGLAVVIIFVFFCKSCFRKRPPLTTTRNPDHKREHQRNLGATNYKPLPLPPSFDLVSPKGPVPTKFERYMPQPAQLVENNNVKGRPEFTPHDMISANGIHTEDEYHLIIETQHDDTAADGEENVSVNDDALTNGLPTTSQLGVPRDSRQRALSASTEDTMRLAVDIDEPRRRSFDDRGLRPGTGRKLPRAHTDTNSYYATQFDEKYGDPYEHPGDPMVGANQHFFRSANDPFRMPRSAQQWTPAECDRRSNSPRSAFSHLPRSYQIVIEKASPPMPRKQISSPLPPRGPDKPPYDRGHRNSLSWDEEARRHMAAIRPPPWLNGRLPSYGGQVPRALPLLRTPPDPGSDLSVPTEADELPVRYSNNPLQKLYQQVQQVFTAERINPSPANSTAARIVPHTAALAARQWERQAKSLEEANRVGLYPRMDGQVHGRSFEMDNCAACRNDIMQQKLAHYRGETLSAKPTMQRQRKVDGDDIEDAEREQIKNACVNLWSIRSTLEDTLDFNDGDNQHLLEGDDNLHEPPAMGLQRSVDRSTDGGSGDGSYTTSFESNTEPVMLNDYLKQHRPSGPFLEPPRQGAEVKRQKYKNLFARRKWELQQQASAANSFDNNSFESVGTFSSESSYPEPCIFPASFESNRSDHTDSTVDSQGRKRIAELKNDSGYKSQSTEHQFQQQTFPDQVTTVETAGPSQQRPYEMSREKRRNDAFFQEICDTDSAGVSGESFDDSNAAKTTIPGIAPHPNTTQRVRRGYDVGLGGYYRQSFTRDYSIDSKTDNTFREFLRFDPKLEINLPAKNYGRNGTRLGSSPRNHSIDSEPSRARKANVQRPVKDKMFARMGDSQDSPLTYQHPIPLIRFPDEQEVSG